LLRYFSNGTQLLPHSFDTMVCAVFGVPPLHPPAKHFEELLATLVFEMRILFLRIAVSGDELRRAILPDGKQKKAADQHGIGLARIHFSTSTTSCSISYGALFLRTVG
ncbi:MAG: hypothetical protein LUO89_10975, partial [Methanothrix sp.]|nr:hypothetical protein [Methanothrix sp.]